MAKMATMNQSQIDRYRWNGSVRVGSILVASLWFGTSGLGRCRGGGGGAIVSAGRPWPVPKRPEGRRPGRSEQRQGRPSGSSRDCAIPTEGPQIVDTLTKVSPAEATFISAGYR